MLDCSNHHRFFVVKLFFLCWIASIMIGKSTSHTGLAKRASLILRPTSPKSPVASASAFESVEGSDDEVDVTDNANLDPTYLHTNGNAVKLYRKSFMLYEKL